MDQQIKCSRCNTVVIGHDGIYGNNANAIEITVYGKKGEPKKRTTMVTGLCDACVSNIEYHIMSEGEG